ncbi:hypothetical protein P280DRAFT_520754 [Massarina eburnea CBS 473.64]|uniref:Uncharacterized protein n=1 Tax=Massarina eburnea CBS 473.64 TaxID=1395130 RepID=A0A6A6RSI4_9PLEO|nr:hypothetical protein P280DRAFT_520754 [Massarina eburnea CBS 473.64]
MLLSVHILSFIGGAPIDRQQSLVSLSTASKRLYPIVKPMLMELQTFIPTLLKNRETASNIFSLKLRALPVEGGVTGIADGKEGLDDASYKTCVDLITATKTTPNTERVVPIHRYPWTPEQRAQLSESTESGKITSSWLHDSDKNAADAHISILLVLLPKITTLNLSIGRFHVFHFLSLLIHESHRFYFASRRRRTYLECLFEALAPRRVSFDMPQRWPGTQ